MDLKDFIKNSISSISEAITESQTDLKEAGVIVNPEKMEIGKQGDKLLNSRGWRYTQDLEFDVLVAVDETVELGGKSSLKIAGVFDLSAGASSDNTHKKHSRIKFSIPVAFSASTTPDEYKPSPPKFRAS